MSSPGKRHKAAKQAPPAAQSSDGWTVGRGAAVLALAAWAVFLYARLPVGVPLVASQWAEFLRSLAAAVPARGAMLAGRLAGAAGLWLVAAGLGHPVLRRLGLDGTRAEAFLLAAGLGFGGLSLALLGLGACGLYSPRALAAFFLFAAAAAAAVGGMLLRNLRAGPAQQGPRNQEPPAGDGRAWLWAALAVLAPAAALNLFSSLAPEIYYDSLVCHLALPSLYLLKGGIVATPSNAFSGAPLAGQLLYGLVLALHDEKLASVLHASFGLATAGLIGLMGRRFLSASQGAWAALAFYAAPMTMYAGWSCGVDLMAAFYGAAALLAALRTMEDGGDGEPGAPVPANPALGWSAACGLFLGLAAGIKYNALQAGAVVAAAHLWSDLRRGLGWRRSAVLAWAAFAVFAPWLAKNAALFGNPFYPFLAGLFPGRGLLADRPGFFSASRSLDIVPILSSLAGIRGWLGTQWTAFLGRWPMGDWPGLLALAFAPWALFTAWRRPREKALLLVAALGYLACAATSGLMRFMLPVFPAAALALAHAAADPAWPGPVRAAGWLAACWIGLFQVQTSFKLGYNMGLWRYLTGQVSREDYLRAPHDTYGLPYYAAAEFINRELPRGAKVLLLGESRSFYVERETVAATLFDHNPFWLAVRDSRDHAEIRERLRAMGVTHLLVNAYQFIYRSESACILPRDLASRDAFREFWSRWLKPVFERRGGAMPNAAWLVVYELRDRPDAGEEGMPNPPYFAVKALEEMARRNRARP